MRFHHLARMTAFVLLSTSIVPGSTYPVASTPPDSAALNGPLNVTVIHEFNKGTWVENLAIRKNGQILATLLSTPELHQIDPVGTHDPVLVHRFPSALGALGIVEASPDIFYVVTGNFSLSTFVTTPGSYSVWKVDMNTFVPQVASALVTKVADFPQAAFLNGAALLDPAVGYILLADSGLGAVWRLNVTSGQVVKVIQDVTMAPTAFPAIGINGLKIRDGVLYFSNTNTGNVSRIPIRPDGTAAGTASITVSNATGVDDFIFDTKGDGFHALGTSNELGKLPRGGATVNVLVGSPSDFSTLAGATACQFGRGSGDQRSLYISSTGGISGYIGGTFVVGGRISRIDVRA